MRDFLTTEVEPTRRRDPALDGVRGVACLAVYFYHLGIDLRRPPLIVEGYTGVFVFFILSGYLMFEPFVQSFLGMRSLPSWRSYAIRRFTRIYPPYLVALLIYTIVRFAMEALRPGGTRSRPPTLAGFTSHALLIFNYVDRKEFFAICGAFWTLAIEAQFYAILPIVGLLATWFGVCGRGSLLIFVALFGAIGPASRSLELRYFHHQSLSNELPRFVALTSYLDMFAVGMALAVLARTSPLGRSASASRRWVVFGIGAALFLGAENWSIAVTRSDWQTSSLLIYTTFYATISTIGLGLMLLTVITRSSVGAWPLTSTPLVKLGEISYSIYLYHMLIQMGFLAFVPPFLPQTHRWGIYVTALIALIPTVFVATLGYYFVERPSFLWGLRHSAHEAASLQLLQDTSLKPKETPASLDH